MTPEQLMALMEWVAALAQLGTEASDASEKRKAELRMNLNIKRIALYVAFGFEVGKDGKPVLPTPKKDLN